MTTIRKIVTSKIDGDSANNTSTDEIRPFGETAFYLDTSGDVEQLTLMMFDGQRTHLKSKVLKQGVLFGSNADAGDDSGADTIKLIPDAELYNNGSDQYLIIDPTEGEPGHIHLRAGGTQDASTADLYLGGELTFVRVSDTSESVTIRTTNVGDPNITLDWSFQPDGNLYFPGTGNNRIGESEPGLVVSSDNAVVIQSNNTGESNEWLFGTNGSLQLPSGGLGILKTIQSVNTGGLPPIDITGNVVFADANAAGDHITLLLPQSPPTGAEVTVKNINSGGFSVNVLASTDDSVAIEALDGTISTTAFGILYGSCHATWIYDGATWRIIDRYTT